MSAVEELLDEHYGLRPDGEWWRCACGEAMYSTPNLDASTAEAGHREHLAALIEQTIRDGEGR